MNGVKQNALFDLGTELPEGYRYVPEFITEAEEAALVAEIERLPLQEAQYREYTAKRRVMRMLRYSITFRTLVGSVRGP